MVDIDKRKKVTKPDYPKKFGSSKKSKNVVKMTVTTVCQSVGCLQQNCPKFRQNLVFAVPYVTVKLETSAILIWIYKYSYTLEFIFGYVVVLIDKNFYFWQTQKEIRCHVRDKCHVRDTWEHLWPYIQYGKYMKVDGYLKIKLRVISN